MSISSLFLWNLRDKAWYSCCDDFVGEVNLPPDATWDQNGITIAGSANGVPGLDDPEEYEEGSSFTMLRYPRGLSVTNDDLLYICDMNNDRIVVADIKFQMEGGGALLITILIQVSLISIIRRVLSLLTHHFMYSTDSTIEYKNHHLTAQIQAPFSVMVQVSNTTIFMLTIILTYI